MPRADYSYHVTAGRGASDIMLLGNLDSNDSTTPEHHLQLAYVNTTGQTFFQRETAPNSFLNGRIRLFFKIVEKFGSDVLVLVIARSSLPIFTLYLFRITSRAGGITCEIDRFVNGTFTNLAVTTLTTAFTLCKGTLMGEIIGSSLRLYANVVPLTDPDSSAYILQPPLKATASDTAISTAGKFGFGFQTMGGSGGTAEIDRFHVFEIT
jgi:hypothetical protein